MSQANFYRRAVGYFTSHGLALAAKGVAHLLKNGGQIKLLASPVLSEEDISAIERGYDARDKIIITAAARSFEDVTNRLLRDRLNALAWLVESGALEVKLALRVDGAGRLCRGIFHEKMGIFTDEIEQSVAFSGSANETEGGLVDNFEAIDVFWSWQDPDGRVDEKVKRFEKFWSNRTLGLQVIDFTEATAELLNKFKRKERPDWDPEEELQDQLQESNCIPEMPMGLELRDYQEQAIRSWFKNNGKGTFKMATGSGKTVTALSLVVESYQRFGLKAIIIICPYRHLVTQWADECRKFSLDPILAFESRNAWESLLSSQLYSSAINRESFICVITTNKTFAGELFQQKISHFSEKTLIIADEVHNLGAGDLRTKLPSSIYFRLGLSATPERWFDDAGTQALYNYFGEVLEPQITLADALAKGVLSPYRYYPILVELTDDERQQYLEFSKRIAQIVADDKYSEGDQRLTALLVRRSRLVAGASEKIVALRELSVNLKDETHMLFYCGDGTVEDSVTDAERRQIDVVMSLLGYERGIRVSPYTAETPSEERSRLTRAIDTGEIQGLVAIRCLDEGVDIPSVRTAVFLASSRNPRQFIQRRGRILRRAPGKGAATIYDMIVVPPTEAAESESERTLLRNELIRFSEFSDLALNSGEARSILLDLQQRFDLMDL